jgi:glycosyltransferase involved in cell wall biosynthesis
MRVNEKMGKSFAAAGMRVSWVGPDIDSAGRSGRKDEGFSWHLYPPLSGKIGRLMSHREAKRVASELKDVDIYYCPDPDSAVIGVQLAKQQGARVIFDIHENYHLSQAMTHWGGAHMRLFGHLIKLGIRAICRRCDLVIGVNRHVLEPYLAATDNSLIVRSCAPKWFGDVVPADVCDPNRDTFTLMHGKGASGRGTEVVLNAIKLAKPHVDGLRVIVFNIFTEKVDQYGERVFRQHLENLGIADNVKLLDPVPLSSMPSILQSCDAGLIGYGRGLGVGSLPNRLFEYMAVGLPIIAPNYAVEIAEIVELERCGILADFENSQSIADAIIELYKSPTECSEMGHNGRTGFCDRHNWDVEVSPLLKQVFQWFS